ncbi:inorganic diphosphatase [Pseudomonas sp. HY13-MNA-CIBAN-0226]|uniref:inorganic diphosphatase n=1 Tax=Pseudomonas sp. HY13-MNA-CIBAN-0226 TaxID=3140473 RepID=UPI00331C5AA4
MMCMTDEAGADAKVIAVPHKKLTSMYNDVKECSDAPCVTHRTDPALYKALEPGKWVRTGRWGSADEAREEICKSVAA